MPGEVPVDEVETEEVDDGSLDSSGWKFSGSGADSIAMAFDGKPDTMWKSDNSPAHIVIDMKKKHTVTGFAYLPRQDEKTVDMTSRYRLELSSDGKKWETASESEFGNLRANPVEQVISFDEQKARYIRFTSTAALDGNGSSAAEIRIMGN